MQTTTTTIHDNIQRINRALPRKLRTQLGAAPPTLPGQEPIALAQWAVAAMTQLAYFHLTTGRYETQLDQVIRTVSALGRQLWSRDARWLRRAQRAAAGDREALARRPRPRRTAARS